MSHLHMKHLFIKNTIFVPSTSFEIERSQVSVPYLSVGSAGVRGSLSSSIVRRSNFLNNSIL